MRHLYGIEKTAAQKKAAFAQKLVAFMRASRGTGVAKTAADRKEAVRELIRKAAAK